MARKVGLDRRQVIEAAIALADADGLENVTLARVAAALAVSSPSLYSHVDGLASLRRELAIEASTRLGAAVREAVAGNDGRAALNRAAHAYRTFALTHPGLYATLHTTPARGQDVELSAAFDALVPDIAAVLTQVGLPEHDAVPLIRTLRSALHGFVSLEASGGFGLPDDIGASFEVLIDVVVQGMLARRPDLPEAGGANTSLPPS
jgi:AcrR family transcriptional regulator